MNRWAETVDLVTRLRDRRCKQQRLCDAWHRREQEAVGSRAAPAVRGNSGALHHEAADEIERLRRPFRHADKLDWMRLFDMLGDGGYGKFWKEVFREARDASQTRNSRENIERR